MAYQFDLLAIAKPKYIGWLKDGLFVTVEISVSVIVLSTLWSACLAVIRESGHRALAWVVRLYQEIFRNTPLLIQLFFWYFGASQIVPTALMQWLNARHAWQAGPVALVWPSFEFIAAAFGLTLFSGAFIADELRAGIQSIARGQREAALALGLTYHQTMRFVIIPQALRIALAPLFGQYLNIVKNSSLALTIGLAELSYQAREIETETFRSFEAFGVVTVLYIVLMGLISGIGELLGKRALHHAVGASSAHTPFERPARAHRIHRIHRTHAWPPRRKSEPS